MSENEIAENKQVKVSVIIPAYNAEEYIEKCITSLINQTLKDIEIIVVNDGSTDGTEEIARKLALIDKRITVLSQENKLQGAARNAGTNISRGEYIGFVDADDWVDLDYYEKLYLAAKKYNSDIALANYTRIGNGKTKKRLNIEKEEFVTGLQEKIDICSQVKNPCPTNKIYRRETLVKNNIEWEEGVYCEDKIFTLKAIYYANGVVTVPEITYYYYRSPHSTVKTKDKKHLTKIAADKNKAKIDVLSFLKEKNADIRDGDFWAVEKDVRLFGLPLYQVKSSLHTKKYRLFSIIPIKKEKYTDDFLIIRERYARKLESLKEKIKTDKIRVAFLVRENQKWGYQSLYELFKSDERFEPIVLVSLLGLAHKGKDKTRFNLEENYDFFKKKGMNVKYAYINGKYLNLKSFNPDIVFYDQPWDLPEIHSIKTVSEFALTCYIPYGVSILDLKDDYTQDFHKLLYRYYVDSPLNIKRYEFYQAGNSGNCTAAGYPKLDVYFEKSNTQTDIWRDKNKIKIIYAPHHSFDKGGLHTATFKENGQAILNLAKKYANETTWIFKPHPRFKYAALRRKIMTTEEIKKYYQEWAEIGNIYTQGDYFDIFKSSDLMITDCCSFLGEYLPADKPIIRLVSPNSLSPNELGRRLFDCCYEVKNNTELERVFKMLVIDKNDYKKQTREAVIPQIIDYSEKSGEKIYKNLLAELQKGV